MYALPPAQPASVPSNPPGGGQRAGATPPPAQVVTSAAPQIVQTVQVEHTPARTDMLVDTEKWTWEELRDFVAAEIISRFGPFPRVARKEFGIFSRYINQYGSDGIAVAKYAFGPVQDGWWGQAPISINRFCKASDPYFTVPILERLTETGILVRS